MASSNPEFIDLDEYPDEDVHRSQNHSDDLQIISVSTGTNVCDLTTIEAVPVAQSIPSTSSRTTAQNYNGIISYGMVENPTTTRKATTTGSSTAPPLPDSLSRCGICWDRFNQPTSTKCGHVFCNECLRMAISRTGKCPTCRKKVTIKQLMRIYI